MSDLDIALLGPFQATLNKQPLNKFRTSKVQALLIYLVVEDAFVVHPLSHRREALMTLLWPDLPPAAAQTNLRQAIYHLRQAIPELTTKIGDLSQPFLLTDRQTVQINPAVTYGLDVAAFTRHIHHYQTHPHPDLLTCIPCQAQLQTAVSLYRGDFLTDFYLADSNAFEEWALVKRELLRRQALEALQTLTAMYLEQRAYRQAQTTAWRQLEIDNLREVAYRQLMAALAGAGQCSGALSQYERCCRVLRDELDLAPAAETTALFEQIKAGRLDISIPSPVPSAKLPAFLKALPQEPISARPTFVARQRELTWLDEYLAATLDGHGRTVFITGEAGCGKTALIEAFAHRAQANHPDLIVAEGNCNAYTGIGDPYLPFRQILELLTGEVEARYAVGAISRQQAGHLWNLIPWSIEAILAEGRDLIETFLPGEALVRRATTFVQCSGRADWLSHLVELVERRTSAQFGPSLQQNALFEQYGRVLQALASQRPLLLLLDDLQWSDPGSSSLLFHLSQRLENSRVLLLGAYRPDEVALGAPLFPGGTGGIEGRAAARHPLEPVINELKGHFGEIELDLDQADGRQFIDALLDTEPNRLGDVFRKTLYRQTRGHPLFTVELLRGMQERGDLVQDQKGYWIQGPALDWEILPARVEAVIAERVGQLAKRLQQALIVASVQGEIFSAELIAMVEKVDELDMVQWLSGELERKYHLVKVQGIRQINDGGQHLSQYRFQHILFQKYLYNALDQVERAYLHQAVGTALEALYGPEATEITVQLARHFQEAGIVPKAIDYLRQAGEWAVRLSANEEAITHFSQALELLKTLPDTPERKQQEVTLQIALGSVLSFTKGNGLPEVAQVYNRARELCQELDESTQLFPVLFGLWAFHFIRVELPAAYELGQQFLHLAQRQPDPAFLVVAHHIMGTNLYTLGKSALAREHLEQGLALYNRPQHRSLAHIYFHDPEMANLVYLAMSLWLLGYPDQALEKTRQALALDQEVSHPLSLAFTLTGTILLHQFRREAPAVHKQVESLLSLSDRQGFAIWTAGAIFLQGWALAEQGQRAEGIARMTDGITAFEAAGSQGRPIHLALLAETYGKIGQVNKGLALLDKALTIVDRTGERYYEAEIHRLRGELLLKVEGGRMKAELSPNDSCRDAESCFQRAIEVARAQQAKSWELRATVSLSRLWQMQGKMAEARQMLAEIYNWFTEGFDTADLQEAKTLLEAIRQKQTVPRPVVPTEFSTALVGRATEMECLGKVWQQVKGGQGQMVLVAGEPGIGKTRLIEELLVQITQQTIILRAKCPESEHPLAYTLFVPPLRWLFAQISTSNITDAWLVEISRLLPELQDRYPDLPQPPRLAPSAERRRLFDAICGTLVSLAQPAPLIFFVDDLQWADATSLALLSHLNDWVVDAPVLVIGAYRPHEVGPDHPLYQTRAVWERARNLTILELENLSYQAVTTLLQALTTWPGDDPAFGEFIFRETAGNPLFVVETVAGLQEQGCLPLKEEDWPHAFHLETVTIPRQVQRVIENRFKGLPASNRRLIMAASVLRSDFSTEMVQAVSRQSEEETLEGLEHLLTSGLLVEQDTGRCTFSHDKIREVAYAGLSRLRRKQLHRRVAETLEEQYQGQENAVVERLAYHWAQAEELAQAIPNLIQAGQHACKAYASDEAIVYFEHALNLIDSLPLDEHRKNWQLESLMHLAQLYHTNGKLNEAEQFLREAVTLGREMGREFDELEPVYLWLGGTLWRLGKYDDSIIWAIEEIASAETRAAIMENTLLDDVAESAESALAFTTLSTAYLSRGEMDKHYLYAHYAEKSVVNLPDSFLQSAVYLHIAWSYGFRKDLAERAIWLQKLEHWAIQNNDLMILGLGHRELGMTNAWIGDLHGADTKFKQALELYMQTEDMPMGGWCEGGLGESFLLKGDLQQAEAYSAKSIEILKQLGKKDDLAWGLEHVGRVALAQKASAKALEAFQQATNLYQEVNLIVGEARTTYLTGRGYLSQGNRAAALKQFQAAMKLVNPADVLGYIYRPPGNIAWYPLITCVLSGLEAAYKSSAAFRAFCRRWQREHPQINDSHFRQWYLEPAEVGLVNLLASQPDDFVETFEADWEWQNEFEDCSFTVQNGLEIRAANGRDLWHLNMSAPRLVRAVSGDFAMQTCCQPVSDDQPAIGGLVLWKDRENFLRLDRGMWGRGEIFFGGVVANEDIVVGRGYLNSERIFLRLERRGEEVRALCSKNGKSWFTAGRVHFAIEDPLQVELYAIGHIDRTIYPGVHPDGTAIRFEAIWLSAA